MQQTITLPYLRTSPLYIPRRDLVASASDSLALRVTVVEHDDPCAQLLVITGGLGGPAARLVIWADYAGQPTCWDYGRPMQAYGTPLWSGMGEPQVGIGAFDFWLPFMTMATFPPRCGWAVQLSWDGGRKSDLLSRGSLHLSGPDQEMAALIALTTDTDQPITADDDTAIFA